MVLNVSLWRRQAWKVIALAEEDVPRRGLPLVLWETFVKLDKTIEMLVTNVIIEMT